MALEIMSSKQVRTPNSSLVLSHSHIKYHRIIFAIILIMNTWRFRTTSAGANGQIASFVGDDMSFMISGSAIGPNDNVNSWLISEEPHEYGAQFRH